MSKNTPFLNQDEAHELFWLMSKKTKRQRRKLAALNLLPRQLLEHLKEPTST